MLKILSILFVGLVFEAVGVVLLKGGIDTICQGKSVTLQNILPIVLKGALNPKILLGVLFEALFFVGLLYLISQKDVSFIWPMTSLSFVITTLAAVLYLKEHVSAERWIGVALIMAGAALITWNEKQNELRKASPPGAVAAAPTEQR